MANEARGSRHDPVLRDLRRKGLEVRSAAFVNDVLIALSARAVGACVFTRKRSDFDAIRTVSDFDVEIADA